MPRPGRSIAALFSCKRADPVGLAGPLGNELIGSGVAVVGEVEAGSYGAAQECNFPFADEAGALPYACGDDQLDMVTGLQVWSESKNRGTAVCVELQHFHWVAEVEVEGLIGVEDVHLGESAGLEEVVNRGGGWADAAGELEGGR